MAESNGAKEFNPEASQRSIIATPPPPNGSQPYPSLASQAFWFNMPSVADDITPWGVNPKLRDKQLRNIITEENVFASSLGIVSSRNASFSWRLIGPDRTVRRLQDVLENANNGLGWENLIIQTSLDLYSQDSGAFWEIVRNDNSRPDSPVISINHLDSARCYHTGAPEAPVIYHDRLNNYHLLKWWNVVTFAEMPTPIEGYYGLQYCALTRLMRALQIRRNISLYEYEKTGGRNTKAIIMVKGITTQQLQDAMNQANANADSAGLLRYVTPVLVGALDPKADVGHDKIDMRSMPEDYDADVFFKEYINQVAMAFLSDYQEFAPLPGGNLGTSNQSQILHLKNHGKGPGLFRKLLTHAINFRIMPRNAEFQLDDPDYEAEKTEAEVRNIRANTRSIRIQSGELTPEAARQIANDEGDLRQEYMVMMGANDLTDSVMVDDDSPPESQLKNPYRP